MLIFLPEKISSSLCVNGFVKVSPLEYALSDNKLIAANDILEKMQERILNCDCRKQAELLNKFDGYKSVKLILQDYPNLLTKLFSLYRTDHEQLHAILVKQILSSIPDSSPDKKLIHKFFSELRSHVESFEKLQ